ncbi:DNA-deoxyinosine glycosylase [Haloimpatiens lingqiaonensis]|jgi:hypoxanthine-DNA glycosylase|uniref:DNA-deoxyinosine glycosylase n=1 Tax=Haloimpatiens lingqiaonensis TaxID=1380675 RepID=UPI0010FE7D90|nr:DNA-deoxyinosine glycosylase [Haloimpatiens lingqiaonensis]
MTTSFEPIIDKNCKILILGTMPSVRSLEKQQYYGNKRNQFWKIIYGLSNKEVEEDYENRKTFLLNQHIAIWDVLKSCDREGSSDSKIINPVSNDFETFFNQYPGIKTVFFNGSKAEELFIKLVIGKMCFKEGLLFYRLPSTSPANAIRFKDKLERWKVILSYLGFIDNRQ